MSVFILMLIINGKLGYAGELRFDYAMGFIRCVEKIHLCGSVFCQFNTGIPK